MRRTGLLLYLVQVALVAGAFYGAVRFAFATNFIYQNDSPFWPATGISISALMLGGYRLWPGVFIGSLLGNVYAGSPFPVSLGPAAGAVAEAVVAVYLLRRVDFRATFERVRDVFSFAFAILCATTLSATIGGTSLWLDGTIPGSGFGHAWWIWWLGNATGALVVAPAVLVWTHLPRRLPPHMKTVEAIAVFAVLVFVSDLIFAHRFETRLPSYPVLGLVVWAALRFRQLGAATALAAVSLIAVWHTGNGLGPFYSANLTDSIARLNGFVGIAGITALVLAAAFSEREAAEQGRRRLEEELRQRQTLEAIGRLAGGVAHDFNNVLTVILGHARLMLERLGAGDPLRRDAATIADAAVRSAKLTGQLLAFGRRQVLEAQPLDVNSVVSDMETMLRRLIGSHIELVTELQPGLGSVQADPSQLEQVILNLVLNARDAMPMGGTLTISTQEARHPDQGGCVALSVHDTGTGIDEQTREHLFEPFFTTKETGRGTGLGLATVYGIVEQSGGAIEVGSEPGRGSTFTVYLPLSGVRAAPEPEKPARDRQRAAGNETVLLVEDEDPLRSLVRHVLEEQGYDVLEAGSAQAALELAERHADEIDLLLTDVVMPGMSGRELAQLLTEARPGLRTLFMSGYSGEAIAEQGLPQALAAFIGKPFEPEDLADRVRDVLDRAS